MKLEFLKDIEAVIVNCGDLIKISKGEVHNVTYEPVAKGLVNKGIAKEFLVPTSAIAAAEKLAEEQTESKKKAIEKAPENKALKTEKKETKKKKIKK